MANTLSTNLSLQTPVIESITPQDRLNTQSAFSANMAILEKAIAGVQTAATVGVNASVVNTGGNRIVQLQMLSNGCIASITGMITGMPFTLIFQSVGSIGIADAGSFKIAGAFNATLDDCLTLVWDGNNYYEVARSSN